MSPKDLGPVTYFDTAGVILKRRLIDLGKVLAAVPGASRESPTVPLPDRSFVVTVRRTDPQFAPPRAGTLVRYPPVEYFRVDLGGQLAKVSRISVSLPRRGIGLAN